MSSSPFGFPLPPCSPRILHPSCLSSPREKLSLLLSLDVTVFSRSFPSLYVPSLPYFPYFLISCVSTTLSCLPSSSRRLEISTPLGLFREHIYTYNHFHLSKVPAFELSLSRVVVRLPFWPHFPSSSESCPFRARTKQQTKYKRSNNAPAWA